MAGIMADHNVEGHFVVLLRLWTSDAWRAVWESLQLEVESFERLGIPHDTSDHDLWQLCQRHEIILLTANRNDEGPHSLEATIRTLTVPLACPSGFPPFKRNTLSKIWLVGSRTVSSLRLTVTSLISRCVRLRHYAQLVKVYGAPPANDTRYSPAECIRTIVNDVVGNPDPKYISTSYVELDVDSQLTFVQLVCQHHEQC